MAILNRAFSPEPERLEAARRAAAAFEAGLARGTASVDVDGAMVDTPVYNRARRILARAEAVAAAERPQGRRPGPDRRSAEAVRSALMRQGLRATPDA